MVGILYCCYFFPQFRKDNSQGKKDALPSKVTELAKKRITFQFQSCVNASYMEELKLQKEENVGKGSFEFDGKIVETSVMVSSWSGKIKTT